MHQPQLNGLVLSNHAVLVLCISVGCLINNSLALFSVVCCMAIWEQLLLMSKPVDQRLRCVNQHCSFHATLTCEGFAQKV